MPTYLGGTGKLFSPKLHHWEHTQVFHQTVAGLNLLSRQDIHSMGQPAFPTNCNQAIHFYTRIN